MYFKDKNNEIHFLENESHISLLPEGSIKITDDEADALIPKTSAQDLRKLQITMRLVEIDAESIRAIRSTVAASAKGKPVPAFDADKLTTLEAEAAALRTERAALQ